MQKVTSWLENTKLYLKIKIAGILLIPAILFLVPVDWLEKQPSICLFKCITGRECYGCGMTRAVLSTMHLRFTDAFDYNKLVIIVLPLLVYIWINYLLKTRTDLKRIN
jgi:hypothetical protein